MASGTAASVELYAIGLQRVLTVKNELMSACGRPFSDTPTAPSDVRFQGGPGRYVLMLSSSQFDPKQARVDVAAIQKSGGSIRVKSYRDVTHVGARHAQVSFYRRSLW